MIILYIAQIETILKSFNKKVFYWCYFKVFLGGLKVEMFYGGEFESVNAFIDELKRYIYYSNNEKISMKLKGMSPIQYRTHSQII